MQQAVASQLHGVWLHMIEFLVVNAMQSYVISTLTLLLCDFWWENAIYEFWRESL